jgi:hypothetical protein
VKRDGADSAAEGLDVAEVGGTPHNGYRMARIAIAIILALLVLLIYLGDFISSEFSADTFQLALILGTVGALLAVDGIGAIIERVK